MAVCERCKKNFKTRDHCRTRDCHVDLPWSETFVCVSLDPSCTDDDGNLLEGPFYARTVPAIAFNYSGELDRKTPICAPCKDKNYTRNYCRNQKRHRQLPWSTVYVILTLTPDNFVGPDFAYFSPHNAVTSVKKRKKLNSGETIKAEIDAENVSNEGESDEEGGDQAKDDEIEKDSPKDKGRSVVPKDETDGGDKEDKGGEGDEGEDEKDNKAKEDTDKKDKATADEVKGSKGKSQPDDEDDEASDCTEESKKIKIDEEAEKMKDIPRSRTLLASVSCKGITIEVSEKYILFAISATPTIIIAHISG